jgi:hypothetical protein
LLRLQVGVFAGEEFDTTKPEESLTLKLESESIFGATTKMLGLLLLLVGSPAFQDDTCGRF